MHVRPLTKNCARVAAYGTHAVLGVSPFNSYFSEDRLRTLIQWALQSFERIHVFVPDEPATFTLEALGYDPKKAHHKARRQANYLHNKIKRAFEANGISGKGAAEMTLGWERLQSNSRYTDGYAHCRTMFERDPEFRSACLDSSRWVLNGRTNGQRLEEASLRRAAQYFLTEVPLFADSAGILCERPSVFCYHQSIPFLEDLYNNRLPITPDADQGYVVVTDHIEEREAAP